MKRLNFVLVLFCLPLYVAGQEVYQIEIKGYYGNAVESQSIGLAPIDTVLGLSVTAYYGVNDLELPTKLQPRLIRNGLKAIVRWDSSRVRISGKMVELPLTSWYRLKANGQTRFDGPVTMYRGGVIVPNTSGTLIAGINSKLASLSDSYALLSTTKLNVFTYNSFLLANTANLNAINTGLANLTSQVETIRQTQEPGVLVFDTYALALHGLIGRTKPCRVLITHDEVNNGGEFGKYDYDGTQLVEDLI